MIELFASLGLLAAASASAAPEVTIDSLLASARNVAEAGSSQTCASFVQVSPKLNSANLFYGSVVCHHQKQLEDSAFLLLLGQARATTDMALFEPANEEAKTRVGTLWGLIFYQFGGTGDNAIYQDPARRDALLKRVDDWSPERLQNYHPGWKAAAQPAEEKYQKALDDSKGHRRKQLEDYSRLISDRRYLQARRELDEIQRRNPRGIVQGTEDGKRADELMKEMRTLEQEINGKK